jgi:hypothetical protein
LSALPLFTPRFDAAMRMYRGSCRRVWASLVVLLVGSLD